MVAGIALVAVRMKVAVQRPSYQIEDTVIDSHLRN
jgi:hypothetical protein